MTNFSHSFSVSHMEVFRIVLICAQATSNIQSTQMKILFTLLSSKLMLNIHRKCLYKVRVVVSRFGHAR